VVTSLGTAAYVSPEQTRGKRLDRRKDMWALSSSRPGIRNFDVTKDGHRFVMIESEAGPIDRLAFVVNWDEELKRLVPPWLDTW
jgi:hypothetical protein